MAIKRGANNNGSVRQRPDGRWEARFTVGGSRKSVYGDTQSDVVRSMRASLKAADEGVYFEPSKLTVGAWLDLWLKEYVEPSVKPLSLAAYKSKCANYIKPALGSAKLAALTAPQIQKMYNDMSRDGLSPKTIKLTHGVLHKAMTKAAQLRYIGYNPADAVELPRMERSTAKPLTDDEVKLFLAEIQEGEPLRDLFTVTLFTGMREGEVCGLPWDAVDFENGTITVKQQLQKERGKGGQFYISTTKSGRERVITCAPSVMQILRGVRARQAEARFKMGRGWLNEWNLVFTNEAGQHLVPETVLKRFKAVAARIGRPDARFHDLRHTFAVMSLQEGDDVKTVQQNLGHATAAFTLDIYCHVSEKMKTESANRMELHIKELENA